jgi:hypothetical protein
MAKFYKADVPHSCVPALIVVNGISMYFRFKFETRWSEHDLMYFSEIRDCLTAITQLQALLEFGEK